MVFSLLLASALMLSATADHHMEAWPQFGSASFGARPLNAFSASKGPFFRPNAPQQIDRRALGRSEDSEMEQQGFMSRIDFDGLLKDVEYGQPDQIEARDGGHHGAPIHHSAPVHHSPPVHRGPPIHHGPPVHQSAGKQGGFIEGQGFQVPSGLRGQLEGFEFGGPFGASSESFASFLQGQGASAGFESAPHKRQIQPSYQPEKSSYQPERSSFQPDQPRYQRPSYDRSGYEEPKQDSYFSRPDSQFKRETPQFSFDGSEFGSKESDFGSDRFVRPEPVYRPQKPKVTPVSQYQSYQQKEDEEDPFANFQFERSEQPARPTPVFSPPPTSPPVYTPPPTVYTTPPPTTAPRKPEYPKPDYKPHSVQKKPVHPPHKYEKKNFRQPVQAKPSSQGDHKLIRVQTTDERFSQQPEEQQYAQNRFGPQPSESFQQSRSESFQPVSHQDRFQPLGGGPPTEGREVQFDNSQAIVTAPPRYLKPAKGQIYNVEVGASFGTNPGVVRQSRSFDNEGFYEGPLGFRPQGFENAFVVDF